MNATSIHLFSSILKLSHLLNVQVLSGSVLSSPIFLSSLVPSVVEKPYHCGLSLCLPTSHECSLPTSSTPSTCTFRSLCLVLMTTGRPVRSGTNSRLWSPPQRDNSLLSVSKAHSVTAAPSHRNMPVCFWGDSTPCLPATHPQTNISPGPGSPNPGMMAAHSRSSVNMCYKKSLTSRTE